MNFTPQHFVRYLGPKGPEKVYNALLRRFGNRWDEKTTGLIADYLYQITAAPASGDYAMNALMQPILSSSARGIYARGILDFDIEN